MSLTVMSRTGFDSTAGTQAQLEAASNEFINSIGRIASFFGFSRMMGQLYAVLFLSPDPLTLDDLKDRLGISKGNVSINIRALERWGLVHQVYKWGERRDYYTAETDIWKIVSGVLQERERKESRQLADSLSDTITTLDKISRSSTAPEAPLAAFYLERVQMLRRFFDFSDFLLDMMVKGGAVDFSTVKDLAQAMTETMNVSGVRMQESLPVDDIETEEDLETQAEELQRGEGMDEPGTRGLGIERGPLDDGKVRLVEEAGYDSDPTGDAYDSSKGRDQ